MGRKGGKNIVPHRVPSHEAIKGNACRQVNLCPMQHVEGEVLMLDSLKPDSCEAFGVRLIVCSPRRLRTEHTSLYSAKRGSGEPRRIRVIVTWT